MQGARPTRLLGFYSAEGVELALQTFGILDYLAGLGYRDFRVAIGVASAGDQLRLYGTAGGREHLLIDCVLDRAAIEGSPVLFVQWLELRHPIARFGPARPRLPGQDVPGPGLAREAGAMLARVAERLDLEGVAFRPSSYHLAYAARRWMKFADPARQARFEALLRQLEGIPLVEATRAVDQGHITLAGAPYVWEATEMCHWFDGRVTTRPPDPARRAT
jgi:hypothetical protein